MRPRASRVGVDEDGIEGFFSSFSSFAAQIALISDPRNPFVFASWFRWLTTAVPVSTRVSNPRNNDAECVAPTGPAIR